MGKMIQIGLAVTIGQTVLKAYMSGTAVKKDPNASGSLGKVDFIENLAMFDLYDYFMLFITIPKAIVGSVVAFLAAVGMIMVKFARCDLPEANSLVAPLFKAFVTCVRLHCECANPVSQSFLTIVQNATSLLQY